MLQDRTIIEFSINPYVTPLSHRVFRHRDVIDHLGLTGLDANLWRVTEQYKCRHGPDIIGDTMALDTRTWTRMTSSGTPWHASRRRLGGRSIVTYLHTEPFNSLRCATIRYSLLGHYVHLRRHNAIARHAAVGILTSCIETIKYLIITLCLKLSFHID